MEKCTSDLGSDWVESKTNKTKTNTKCFKDPMYVIFLKSRGFKDLKYDMDMNMSDMAVMDMDVVDTNTNSKTKTQTQTNTKKIVPCHDHFSTIIADFLGQNKALGPMVKNDHGRVLKKIPGASLYWNFSGCI